MGERYWHWLVESFGREGAILAYLATMFAIALPTFWHARKLLKAAAEKWGGAQADNPYRSPQD